MNQMKNKGPVTGPSKKYESIIIGKDSFKGITLINIEFNNCVFEYFDNAKIFSSKIHNCKFNNPKDFLKALESNTLTKCRTDFTKLWALIYDSVADDHLEETQMFMKTKKEYQNMINI